MQEIWTCVHTDESLNVKVMVFYRKWEINNVFDKIYVDRAIIIITR